MLIYTAMREDPLGWRAVDGLAEALEVLGGGVCHDAVDVGHEGVQDRLRLCVCLHLVGHWQGSSWADGWGRTMSLSAPP